MVAGGNRDRDLIFADVMDIMPASINTPLFNKSRTKLGVKPQGLPPFYLPESVAEALLYAAEPSTRDLIVGSAGQAMAFTQLLSPQLMDALLLRIGLKLQQTNEPKPKDAPDNLFAPISGFDRVKGNFRNKSRAHSYSTWLETHPTAKWGVLASLLVGVGVLALLTGSIGADKTF